MKVGHLERAIIYELVVVKIPVSHLRPFWVTVQVHLERRNQTLRGNLRLIVKPPALDHTRDIPELIPGRCFLTLHNRLHLNKTDFSHSSNTVGEMSHPIFHI